MITQRDRRILRDLAKRVAEISSLPIMAKRREMWKRHNRLERVRPMILVFPEGSWRELLPQSVLCCESVGGLLKGLPVRFAPPHPSSPDTLVKERTRQIEWLLRSRIYHFEHIHDDMVIEKRWVVNKTVTTSGWGLQLFGLNGYGCCEDLTNKLDYVFTIPNLRRISISPWANVDKCAEKLPGNYIFSWKPHPASLVGNFDPKKIREYIKHTLDVTKDCVIEMILKDTHTCENHPERFTQWTDTAQDLVSMV